mmetsp:Transcript_26146/g.71016  ORF Transcript_26146/g.71016 Transcript_26146/m.71016 type:complete len:252 (-) Transcript_26146:76-831(-)
MFRAALRRLARPAPCAAVAAGAALAVGLRPPVERTGVRCDGGANPAKPGGFRMPSVDAEGKGISLAVGKKFMQLYLAEFADAKGKVDLRSNLSFTQAKHLLEAAGGRTKDVQKMFDMMDTDNSNSVDYIEVVAYFCSYGVGSVSDKASFVFHACDIDSSGTVEKSELKVILHQLMVLKKETQGKESFMEYSKTLYAGIPETYVLHLQANELVHNIFTSASKDGNQLTEKEFQNWVVRGGKLVNTLQALLNK